MDTGDSKAAALEDGTPLGKVTKSRGRQTPTVIDEPAFTAWVKARYPTEITETVRGSFTTRVLMSAKAYGAAVDESTGEVIPGVELRSGNPFISWRGDRGWEQVIAARWQELTQQAIALPGGEP